MAADITFVDENDIVIGQGPMVTAVKQGIVHRIVRIFVFNSKGLFLLQKRSANVAVPNRWDQSAAGHVDAGEDYLTAAKRELSEEMSISGVVLEEVGKFYTEEADDLITKKRFNMLYRVTYDSEVKFAEDEVSDIQWVTLDRLNAWMNDKPDDFTEGFRYSYQWYLDRKDAE